MLWREWKECKESWDGKRVRESARGTSCCIALSFITSAAARRLAAAYARAQRRQGPPRLTRPVSAVRSGASVSRGRLLGYRDRLDAVGRVDRE